VVLVYGLLRQVLLLGSLFVFYRAGRLLSAHSGQAASDHGQSLWEVERALRIPSEAALQQLALDAHWTIEFANRYYVWMHFPVTAFFAAWLYLQHRQQYQRMRALLIGVSLPALIVQITYPVAPPRLLQIEGLVDTMARFGPSAYADVTSGMANQYAAMPSLHVGWALICALAAWRVRGHLIGKVMLGHAVVTTLVVVVTANHYWLDAVGGAALVLVVTQALNYHEARRPSLSDGLSNAASESQSAVESVTAASS